MLYKIRDKKIIKMDWEEYTDEIEDPLLISIRIDQLEKLAGAFHISSTILDYCLNIALHYRDGMLEEEDTLYGILSLVNVMEMNANRYQMALIVKGNRLFIIRIMDEDSWIKDNLKDVIEKEQKSISNKATLGRILYSFLESFVKNGNEAIEKMEQQMVDVEQQLIDNRMEQNLNREIFRMKRCLSVWNNYYEQMLEIGYGLEEWGCEHKELEDLRKCKAYKEKVKRLCDSTKDLRESLIHLREALDANLEYNLNHIMKVFTEVTVICLPLNLIAGWYGMNFQFMPELHWKYGYAFVWLLGIGVVSGIVLFFRKKKLF